MGGERRGRGGRFKTSDAGRREMGEGLVARRITD